MIRNHILPIISFILLTACNKALDIPPQDKISNNAYWKTASDLNAYVLQFYGSFPRIGNVDGLYTGYLGSDALNGSDLQIRSTPASQLNGSRVQVNTATGTGWNFTNIRAVNIFFENYQRVKESRNNIARYVGEAHFFKAWFYFNLLKQYGDVPWYSHSMLINDPRLYAPRTLRTLVADSILIELDSAIADLDYLRNADGKNNRLSKEAALIFKSRVALFEGTWQKYHAGTPFGTSGADPKKYFQAAIDAVQELMTPGKYNIALHASYPQLFNSDDLSNNPEVILWRKYDNMLGFMHNLQLFLTKSTDEVSITLQQIQAFLKSDGSIYSYRDTAVKYRGTSFLTKIARDCDPRLKSIIWIPGQTMWSNTGGTGNFIKPALDATGIDKNYTGFQLSKGANPADPSAGGVLNFNAGCRTGSILFRYAEALLNLAEAQAEMGVTVDYAHTINLIRTRAGMPPLVVQPDPQRKVYADYGYLISDELQEIRRERSVELACEGFRYDDWRRWAAGNLFSGKRPLGFPYQAAEYDGMDVPTTEGFVDPYKKSLPSGYYFNKNRDYLDCIPVNEITLNPNLTKNPGW
ncbi:Starch-binding associating with outer membrane [Chitinophaga jiangningensis]|uniref:Starch-binding associating with outer membrane n=1 Tax=Chitinophaga jiangningensis TaxID=1419482 RepID=A0A1M7C335_9BACT|nr:RagB/SusD family nutrient uptake outer membrane protein [Chitinophaga jiangningensis]SHL61712.1 Starch-binding associating with outer membrane [Chitinophaga jiangningensis]